MKRRFLIVIVIIIVIGVIVSNNYKTYAASIGLSINKTSAIVGDTFIVTISGINGRVNIVGNDNVKINPSGSQFVDGSLTINCIAKSAGTGTITIVPVDVTTTDADPVEIKTSASKSIQINEKKEEQKPVEKTSESNQNNTTKTNNNTNKNTNNSKNVTTTKKEEPKVIVNNENQETKEELGIEDMKVFALNKNGEKSETNINPNFDMKIYEYTLNVKNETEKIIIDSKYNEKYNLKIEGTEENLKVGENIVKVSINRENESKTYIIKITKEESEEIEKIETTEEKVINKNDKIILTYPQFVGILLITILVENTIIVIVYVIIKKKTKTIKYN